MKSQSREKIEEIVYNISNVEGTWLGGGYKKYVDELVALIDEAKLQERTSRKKVYAHRFILNAIKGQIIDHIDGNGLNNQKSNLRFCTHSQNMHNSSVYKSNKSSKYKGVHYSKVTNNWIAHIRSEGKRYVIGNYKTELEAAIAWNERAKELHGAFVKLNTIQMEDVGGKGGDKK